MQFHASIKYKQVSKARRKVEKGGEYQFKTTFRRISRIAYTYQGCL